MKLFFSVVLCFSFYVPFCQDKVLAKLPKEAKSLRAFIPKGWTILDSVRGDFNKDGIPDYAVVTIDSVAEKMVLDSSRSLILLQGKGSGLTLSAYSAKAILCTNCGGVFGDPYAGMTFKGNVLTINHYGGSSWKWSYKHTFQYRGGAWFLIGTTSHSFWSVKDCDNLSDFAGTKYEDINLITGDYEEKEISEDCKLLKNKKGKRKPQPLIELSKFVINN